jgi:muconolactone D-isomerase
MKNGSCGSARKQECLDQKIVPKTMLFFVKMTVSLPPELDQDTAERLRSDEKAVAEESQRTGKWRHLWRIVGQYANISIFDVESPSELHDLLTRLPLFPYMQIEVQALCRHPSSIREEA